MMDVDPRDFCAEALRKIAPACGECGEAEHVVIVGPEIIYPHRADLWRRQDGSSPWYWRCSRCQAYCGVHRSTLKPLGTPAGPETRAARQDAHAAFDPMWKKRMAVSGVTQQTARNRGYKWLAAQLEIDRKDCHIGEMNAETARRVVAICAAARSNK